MDGFVVHEVAPDVVVRIVRRMPDLPAAVDGEVERLWQAASQRVAAGGAGRMFNGRVFSADRITPHQITGHWTEYRRVVAQIEQPALFAELGVRSLAVCGALRCADAVVVGRRQHGVRANSGGASEGVGRVPDRGGWNLVPPAREFLTRAYGANRDGESSH